MKTKSLPPEQATVVEEPPPLLNIDVTYLKGDNVEVLSMSIETLVRYSLESNSHVEFNYLKDDKSILTVIPLDKVYQIDYVYQNEVE